MPFRKIMAFSIAAFFSFILCAVSVSAQARTFAGIFPGLGSDIKSAAFTDDGYLKFGKKTDTFALIGNIEKTGIDPEIVKLVLAGNPGYIVEALILIPMEEKNVSLVNIYNALGKIGDLKGRLYYSETRKQLHPLFEEATRIASERKTTPVPDPAPAGNIPKDETNFLRLKDTNFGNTYYRSEISLLQNGLLFGLTNFKSISYFVVPVIKEGKFIAQLYFEPVKEGVLIFGIAGADISDYVASKIHIQSAIAKRLSVFISWAIDGLKK
ncbi:MAG: hypothetical protein LBH16_11985 [Treponema sp.]|jgi:hypothetical protein|nr:hypothetical protein [Treponema sp.]